MYASPTVLIFSIPTRSATSSNRVNTSSSTTTSSCGAMRDACSVNLTRSANSTVTCSRPSAICASCGARVARLEPVDDRTRQRVAEQVVRPPARAIQLPLPQEDQTLVPLQAVPRRHPDDGDRYEERIGEPKLPDGVVDDPVAHDVVVRDDHDAHDRRVRERQAAEDVAEHEDHHQACVRPFGGSDGDEHPMRRPQPRVEQQDERHPLAPVRREPARVGDTEADHERRGRRSRIGSRDPPPDRRGSRCPPGTRTRSTARCPGRARA